MGQGQSSSIWNGTRVAYLGGASAQPDWDIAHVEESLLRCLNTGLARQTSRNPKIEGTLHIVPLNFTTPLKIRCLSLSVLCSQVSPPRCRTSALLLVTPSLAPALTKGVLAALEAL